MKFIEQDGDTQVVKVHVRSIRSAKHERSIDMRILPVRLICFLLLFLATKKSFSSATTTQCESLARDKKAVELEIAQLTGRFEGKDVSLKKISEQFYASYDEEKLGQDIDCLIYGIEGHRENESAKASEVRSCVPLEVGAQDSNKTIINNFEWMAKANLSINNDQGRPEKISLFDYFLKHNKLDTFPEQPGGRTKREQFLIEFKTTIQLINNPECKHLTEEYEWKQVFCKPEFKAQLEKSWPPDKAFPNDFDAEFKNNSTQWAFIDQLLPQMDKSSLPSTFFLHDGEDFKKYAQDQDQLHGVSLSNGLSDKEKFLYLVHELGEVKAKEILKADAAANKGNVDGFFDWVADSFDEPTQAQVITMDEQLEQFQFDLKKALGALQKSAEGEKISAKMDKTMLPHGYSECPKEDKQQGLALSYQLGKTTRAGLQLKCAALPETSEVSNALTLTNMTELSERCPMALDVKFANPTVKTYAEIKKLCLAEMTPLDDRIRERRDELADVMTETLDSSRSANLHQSYEMILYTGTRLCQADKFNSERPLFCQFFKTKPQDQPELKELISSVGDIVDEFNRPSQVDFFVHYCQGQVPSYLKTTCELKAHDMRDIAATLDTRDISSQEAERELAEEVGEREAVNAQIRGAIGQQTVSKTISLAAGYGGSIVGSVITANQTYGYANYQVDSWLAYQDQLSFCADNYYYCYGYYPSYGYYPGVYNPFGFAGAGSATQNYYFGSDYPYYYNASTSYYGSAFLGYDQ